MKDDEKLFFYLEPNEEEQIHIDDAEMYLRLCGFTNYHIKKRYDGKTKFLFVTDLDDPDTRSIYYSSAKGLRDGVRRLIGK